MAVPGRVVPVRHGKSFFLARYLAPWLMGVFPGIKVLFVTYSDDRARRWGKAAMDLAREWAHVAVRLHR
jgi:hypothetical protein